MGSFANATQCARRRFIYIASTLMIIATCGTLPVIQTDSVEMINRVDMATTALYGGDDNATMYTSTDGGSTSAGEGFTTLDNDDKGKKKGHKGESKREYYMRILDSWRENYDLNVRPNAGGEKVRLGSNLALASIGPVNDFDMVYTLQLFLRQIWYDDRFLHEDEEKIKLNPNKLEQMWLPDTYVKYTDYARSHVHLLPRPNKMIRVSRDGLIYYSARLTITAQCPMDFRSFPMDTQTCHLEYGSYGYDITDLVYEYFECSVDVESLKVALAQYGLLAIYNTTIIDTTKTGNYSALKLSFVFQRRLGFFMIGSYLPCTLIVMLSWVSFWLNTEGTPARVALGIMTVLNMVTLSSSARATLPKVPYNSAMDWFVLACFGFVFSALMEFAIVNFFMRRLEIIAKHKNRVPRQNDQPPTKKARMAAVGGPLCSFDEEEEDIPEKENISFLKNMYRCLCLPSQSVEIKTIATHIDQWSRVLFPLGFVIFNIVYWSIYLPPYMTQALQTSDICNCRLTKGCMW